MNPGVNKQPDASNFLFLAQIYGGINTTTGQAVSASAVFTGDMQGPRTSDTGTNTGDGGGDTGTSVQDPQAGGRRRMVGGGPRMDWATITNLRSALQSHVILSETTPFANAPLESIVILKEMTEPQAAVSTTDDVIEIEDNDDGAVVYT